VAEVANPPVAKIAICSRLDAEEYNSLWENGRSLEIQNITTDESDGMSRR
jgi:hypothetical protein